MERLSGTATHGHHILWIEKGHGDNAVPHRGCRLCGIRVAAKQLNRLLNESCRTAPLKQKARRRASRWRETSGVATWEPFAPIVDDTDSDQQIIVSLFHRAPSSLFVYLQSADHRFTVSPRSEITVCVLAVSRSSIHRFTALRLH
eukprot:42743-Amphidinium_carterae.1